MAEGHRDSELASPGRLPTERLGQIAAECLGRWAAYPTIPGSLRWRRNGLTALREILHREGRLAAARAVVDEQAEDEGLWFVAQTAPEALLQQELRRLHAAVERGAP